MAALGAQSIASSYEQLLHVDADGGGNGTTHVSLKDGDNGTTFPLTLATDAVMVTSTNRLEFGDNASYIHQSADGVLDLVSDTEIEINATTIDINGAVDMSSTLGTAGNITITSTEPYILFDADHADGDYKIGSGDGNLYFIDTSTGSPSITINDKFVGMGDGLNANMTQGLTINQGASDDEILALKSSDVAHGMTTRTETDTYLGIDKLSATEGGADLLGYTETLTAIRLTGRATTEDATRSTSAVGAVQIDGQLKSGTTTGAMSADKNILTVANNGTVRYIFDTDGSFHADVESTTYDAYNDAQLVRAYDISHGKGMIGSKFDQFINYNHETLADLKLVGRDEDGTPNRMVNVTGMQHLHNGAIWQQYTELQKMKELMYDTMVEMLGKEKADQKLTDHDVKLLDNKTLLN